MADPVWVLVMFDLPVATKEQRKGATRYRKLLLDDGFSMVQFSIYSKYLVNASGLRAMLPWIKLNVPVGGAVRMLRLTDEQWASTYRYYGPIEIPPEGKPQQLAIAYEIEPQEKSPKSEATTEP